MSSKISPLGTVDAYTELTERPRGSAVVLTHARRILMREMSLTFVDVHTRERTVFRGQERAVVDCIPRKQSLLIHTSNISRGQLGKGGMDLGEPKTKFRESPSAQTLAGVLNIPPRENPPRFPRPLPRPPPRPPLPLPPIFPPGGGR